MNLSILRNFQWYRRWVGGKWARVTGLLWGKRWVYCPRSVEKVEEDYTQTTFCYCPVCRHELVSDPDAFVYDKEWVRYRCPKCETYSDWHFDAPVPLLLLHFGGHKEHIDRRLADGWYALHSCQECQLEKEQEEKLS